MFSALEWIMKGTVWLVLLLFVGLGLPDGAEELRAGEWGACAAVLSIAERRDALRGDKIVIIH